MSTHPITAGQAQPTWPYTEPTQPAYDAVHDLAARTDLSVEQRHDHLGELLMYVESLMDRLLAGEPI